MIISKAQFPLSVDSSQLITKKDEMMFFLNLKSDMLSHQFVVKTAEVNEEILRFLNFFLNFRQYLEYKVSQITPLQLKGYLTLSFHGL